MKILVVDDNKANVRLLVSMLNRKNHEVVSASNGFQAVEVFKQHIPDMVLMDIMMPGMDGMDCAQQLKQLAGEVYIPIIYVTALSQESALTTALSAGGDDFVSKPINFDILLSKINAHCRIKELNSELALKNEQLAHCNLNLERDQELATHYFEKALKHSCLDSRIIRHHLSSKNAFNGDILMASPRPGGGIYVILGDFTGHGLGASIGSLPVSQVFFSMTSQGAWIGDIAREINRELRSLLPNNMFLAATLLELNSTGERLDVWAGGLPDAYLIEPSQHHHRLIKSTHLPLGILSDAKFKSATDTFDVITGEHVYLYTDGVIEARNTSNETYGSERLHELFIKHGSDAFDKVIGDIQTFTGQQSPTDDTSFIELVCQPIDIAIDSESGHEQDINSQYSIPYTISILLGDSEIKSEADVVGYLSNMICATNFSKHKGIIHTILAEIYSNMLEHGLLHLNSEQKCDDEGIAAYYEQKKTSLNQAKDLTIGIQISYQPEPPSGKLIINMSHNGEVNEAFTTCKSIDHDACPHGRGLVLLENLCEEIRIFEEGRKVEAVYKI